MNSEYQDIVVALAKQYEIDNRPFAVGYSGGKDSSVTVDLVLRA